MPEESRSGKEVGNQRLQTEAGSSIFSEPLGQPHRQTPGTLARRHTLADVGSFLPGLKPRENLADPGPGDGDSADPPGYIPHKADRVRFSLGNVLDDELIYRPGSATVQVRPLDRGGAGEGEGKSVCTCTCPIGMSLEAQELFLECYMESKHKQCPAHA